MKALQVSKAESKSGSVAILDPMVLCPSLSDSERDIAIALCEPVIREIEIKVIAKKCNDIITQAIFDCNFSPEKFDLKLLSTGMASDLKKYFTTITLSELKIAFYLGSRKVFGEYVGLSLVTFYGWLTSYIQSQDRLLAKKKQFDYKEALAAPPPLSRSESYLKMRELCLLFFADYKSGNKYEPWHRFDGGNVNYDFLDSLGEIRFTTERKKEIKALAVEKLIAIEEVEKLSARTSIQRQSISDRIKDITEGTDKVLIRSASKRMALEVYFKDLIEGFVELSDVLPESCPDSYKSELIKTTV